MKDILIKLISSTQPESFNLREPKGEVEIAISRAIELFHEDRGGAVKIVCFLSNYIDSLKSKNDNVSVERLNAVITQLNKTVVMFS